MEPLRFTRMLVKTWQMILSHASLIHETICAKCTVIIVVYILVSTMDFFLLIFWPKLCLPFSSIYQFLLHVSHVSSCLEQPKNKPVVKRPPQTSVGSSRRSPIFFEVLSQTIIINAEFTICKSLYLKHITCVESFSPLVGVREKNVYSVGKTHLFKISNLVYSGREVVLKEYSSSSNLHPARSLYTSTIIKWITFSCLSLVQS